MPRVGKPVSYGPNWLQRRQSGIPDPLGTRTHQAPFFYDGLNVKTLYEAPNENGIFCVEFNPEGSLLAAACEDKNLLLFDTLNPRPVQDIKNAHEGCINGIKFLDSRIFATCSDDCTVALWDLRNLKHRQSQLKAHTNWVKSIDYVPMSRTLVTSGFDGAIISWDLLEPEPEPRPDSNKIYPNKLFNMKGLMRTRLSPDSQKLIISTAAGYLIVVHNLDLKKIENDLKDFKPNMCRLKQFSQKCMDSVHTPGKRNRVELITDFPKMNDAEVIPSIQVHPEGHSVLSRNISHDKTSEWTCVHSIEEIDADDNAIKQLWRQPDYVDKSVKALRMLSFLQEGLPQFLQEATSDLMYNPTDVWEKMLASENGRTSTSGPSTSSRTRSLIWSKMAQNRNDVVQRLNYFIKEPSVMPGFIKEPCFSGDGRIICSPYKMGIRLLSFSPDLLLPWQNLADPPPAQLHCRWEREFAASGWDSIVTTRISPMDNQIVAGSQKGELFLISPFR